MFARLVDESDDKLLGMVAYGIYKTSKREWIHAFVEREGRTPTGDELMVYAGTWTPQVIQNTTDAASSVLTEFASSAIEQARPAILKDALKGDAVRSVLLGMLSAFLYTVALIFVVLVLKAAGVDLLGIAGTIGQ